MPECPHGYPEAECLKRCAICRMNSDINGQQVPGGWEQSATHLVAQWAKERRVFTTEDITAHLGFPDDSHLPNGRNNRIGRLMGRLAPLYRLRVVARTPSRNPQSHGRTIAQWQAK